MILTDTLFILGAGASHDYGLPLGSGLTKEIVDFLNQHQELFYSEYFKQTVDQNGFNKLARIIRHSRTPTIDSFIRDNEKYSELLKAAIAGVLIEHENRVLSDGGFPERDWLAWMFHTKMNVCPDEFKINDVVFLSFNYDRVPEGLFARFMANTYEFDVLEALEKNRQVDSISGSKDRFVYVHGELKAGFQKMRLDSGTGMASDNLMLQTVDPEKPFSVEHLKEISKEIVTISESSGGEMRNLTDKLQYANMFERVKRVFILGIGYHEENLLRIGLDKEKCAKLSERLEFFGGTGVEIRGKERERVEKRMGQGFKLGGPDQDCLAFLQEFMD